ncbi:MAG TPA: pseudouridine-5-phosphate glycosidase [Clostridiales bacterium]|nr:pseudouridine-5-phosphate glycosidase [Clostridiales bacterium]
MPTVFRRVDRYLEVSEEVLAALSEGRGVVALESTVIAHGMPYPRNLETALAVEEVVRRGGAVPATVAVIGGRARVGCGPEDIETLARLGPAVPKASVRDLPVLFAREVTGATTVAATGTIAARAGVRVFVTGGIGGVHRGWGDTLDISADLTVLGRVSLAVVCSGAKAVLDIPATLERLETLGVTVVGLGTGRFPGFWVRETPHPVDLTVSTPEEAAAVAAARFASGLPGAVLVAVPVPAADELAREELDRALDRALAAAEAEGVRGKALTPFLLQAVEKATGGRSLQANAALLRNNAAVGARLALALAEGRAGPVSPA